MLTLQNFPNEDTHWDDKISKPNQIVSQMAESKNVSICAKSIVYGDAYELTSNP